jgi:hypothetical protein
MTVAVRPAPGRRLAIPAWSVATAMGTLACGADEPAPTLSDRGGQGGAIAQGGGGQGGASAAGAGAAGGSEGGTTAGGAAGVGSGGTGAAGVAGVGGNGGTASGGTGGGAGTSTGNSGAAGAGMGGGSAGGATGPVVDRTNPRLHHLQFPADDADPEAGQVLGNQHAYLDTRVAPTGKLVVYLHGAGTFANCGDGALGTLVAGWGFHWFGPCFLSNYGVENCGNDIEGCRLEALEGVDHHAFLQIEPPDSIERRVVRGLRHLEEVDPQGGWGFFVDGEQPRWSAIVITGHSHGASTSAVIGVHRLVARVVSLAGPNDPGQAWLSATPMTPRDRFYGFSHTGDGQHMGHLAAFEALGLPGTPTRVDGATPPYSGSHRLYSSASVSDAHGSVTSGNIAGFVDVWRYLYGAP